MQPITVQIKLDISVVILT